MTRTQQIGFACKALRRDLAAGELRVLALALVVAVASVTAVGFFTDRVGRAVQQQAADVLAADLLASSGTPVRDEWLQAAQERGLDTALHTRFPSVVINDDDESQLVAVKAVSDAYPLRGTLTLATLDAPETAANLDTPELGTAWIDPQLKDILQLSQGDTLALGAKDFSVERIITFEPDAGENFMDLSPRVMIHVDDLPGSELLVEGSRAVYSLLMAGDNADVDGMSQWFSDNFATEARVQGVRDGGPQLQRALDRAETFLGLASVVTVLLAGAAIALAVRHFAFKQADASAVLRTLGASRQDVIVWLIIRLALVAIIASLVGVMVGWLAQLVLADLLSTWFSLALPAPGIQPPIVGTLTAFITLAGFGLLPVIKAGQVPVMRVLQRDYSGLQTSSVVTTVLALLATFLVVWLLSGNLLLSAIVVLGVVAMLAVFAVFGKYLISAVRVLAGARFRLSVAGLQRRASSSVVQLSAFAMGIMALLLIAIVRVDILTAWEQDLPDDAPNVFVVNIQRDQVPGFSERLVEQGIESNGFFPMVRGRMAAHNGVSIVQENMTESDERRARREYNLTYSDTLPAANDIVAGEWWPEGTTESFLSVEREWAEEFNYTVGDTMTFRIAGVETTGVIKNLREVDWESFQVNFFVVASSAMLVEFPQTFVSSFYLDGDFSQSTSAWAREFPGIATLDIGAIVTRIKTLMDRASLAVEYVFFFTLLAGACVLLAAVQSSQNERIRESALLRALGASHQQVRQAVVAEFAILGLIAGFLAALFATGIAWALSREVFELPFTVNPSVWLFGVVGGAVGISIAGYLATRSVLHTPPIVALRNST